MLDRLTLGTGALQNVVDHPEATASLLRDISRSAFSAGGPRPSRHFPHRKASETRWFRAPLTDFH
jgi:hypothetical protein